MLSSFLAFLGISILVIVTPGPDTAITVRNTILGGRRGGLATALGVSTGQAIWAAARRPGDPAAGVHRRRPLAPARVERPKLYRR